VFKISFFDIGVKSFAGGEQMRRLWVQGFMGCLRTAWQASAVIHLPAAAKKPFFNRGFSYAVLNRGDGGVSPHPSHLFASWPRHQVPPITRKRSNGDCNAPAAAETPP
jgi:hypothetical protein